MDNLCRTCLQYGSTLEPLVSKDLIDKIKTLSSIEVEPTDELPRRICGVCIYKLNDFYTFRETIIETDTFLRKNILETIEPDANSDISESFENFALDSLDLCLENNSADSPEHIDLDNSKSNNLDGTNKRIECISSPKVTKSVERNYTISNNKESAEPMALEYTSTDSPDISEIDEFDIANLNDLESREPWELDDSCSGSPKPIETVHLENSHSKQLNSIEHIDLDCIESSITSDKVVPKNDISVNFVSVKEKCPVINLTDDDPLEKIKNFIVDDLNKKLEKSRSTSKTGTNEQLTMQNHEVLIDTLDTCQICDKIFKKTELLEHLKTHDNTPDPYRHIKSNKEGFFKCFCSYQTNDRLKFIEHRKNKAHLRPCPYCPLKPEKQFFYPHIQTHLTDEEKAQGTLLCEICVFKTTVRKELTEHRRTHQPQMTCKYCFMVGPRNQIKIHMRRHTRPTGEIIIDGEKMYSCGKCKFRCKDQEEYKIHRRSHVKITICTICGRDITDGNYQHHMLCHTGGRIDCEICGQSVKVVSYRVHKFRHTVQDRTCGICGQKFTILSLYNSHMKTHRGREKKLKCTFCEKLFRDKKMLTGHIRTHTGERPYPCDICKRSFSSGNALRTHKRQHTNERPYVCQLCSMAFTQRVSLRTHIKSKHNATLLTNNTIVYNDENDEDSNK